MNLIEEINKHGLTKDAYEKILSDIDSKVNGEIDIDWSELKDKYDLDFHQDSLRKASTTIFGGTFRTEYAKQFLSDNKYSDDLDVKLDNIRRERMKLQTANLERNRIDRAQARKEMYFEYIGNVCNTLPLPKFYPIVEQEDNDMSYVLAIADIHYGATFTSVNNEYSPEIAEERFQYLLSETINFVQKKGLNQINVLSLGDTIQGLLRITDLRLNDSSVVKAVVEVTRLIAEFINELSSVCVVDYYHVPTANHSQTRNLGTKANVLADEDFEYIVGQYIKDLCRFNKRVRVHLAEEGSQYIDIDIPGSTVVAGHGHTIKNLNTALRDLSVLQQREINYLMLGHFHGEKSFSVNESVCGDNEVIITPSFVGSDPYSDSIMKGSKAAAKIYGFDEIYGLTETKKIILN